MYKIIGADQREYGPVSADQIRQWIREGRANANTLCQPEGTTGWRSLSTFPEFGFTPPAPPLVPVPPVHASAQSNGNAVTGLVLGIISCCCPCGNFLTGGLGIVFSGIALSQISHNPAQKGKGMATAGLILSIIGLLIWSGIGLFTMLPHGRHLYRHWNF